MHYFHWLMNIQYEKNAKVISLHRASHHQMASLCGPVDNLTLLHTLVTTSNLLGHHDLDKLIVVNLAVTIDVGLPNHLVDFLVSELLAQVSHDVTELGGGDEAVAVLVEHLESLLSPPRSRCLSSSWP